MFFLPTASAFADAWDELARQALIGGGAGPLDVASGNAGAGRGAGAKLQRDMTAQLEQGRRDELHRDMMRLPRGDERRVAWLAVDRLSSQWVSSHPTHRVELNAAEFGETFTTYMGCESRLVRPYTGRSIPCGARRHMVCDAYGHWVGLAALPGAPFTDCHDAIAHELRVGGARWGCRFWGAPLGGQDSESRLYISDSTVSMVAHKLPCPRGTPTGQFPGVLVHHRYIVSAAIARNDFYPSNLRAGNGHGYRT